MASGGAARSWCPGASASSPGASTLFLCRAFSTRQRAAPSRPESSVSRQSPPPSSATSAPWLRAPHTGDARWRRVAAVRSSWTVLASGAAVSLLALPAGRGGFDRVLSPSAVIALGFVVGTLAIAVLVHGAEKGRAQPA